MRERRAQLQEELGEADIIRQLSPDAIDEDDLTDLTTIGAARMLAGSVRFDDWSGGMMNLVGDLIRGVAEDTKSTPAQVLHLVHNYASVLAQARGVNPEPTPAEVQVTEHGEKAAELNNPEIILSLWYVGDDLGMIYSLRARAYIGTGGDEEKLSFLRSRAALDYLVAQPFPIPDRFHTTLIEGSQKRRVAAASISSLNLLGGLHALFEDAIQELEKSLPAQTTLSIPQAPIICLTPLIADSEDRLHPVVQQESR